MFSYIVKRFLLMIPTLIGIITICFVLMRLAPGDPLELRLGSLGEQKEGSILREQYKLMAKQFGLDKPMFLNFRSLRDYSKEIDKYIPLIDDLDAIQQAYRGQEGEELSFLGKLGVLDVNLRLNEYARGDWTLFCRRLREEAPAAEEACVRCDRLSAIKAERENSVIAYICCHGMIDFAVPVLLDGIVIAVLFSGQRKPKPGTFWDSQIIEGGFYRQLSEGEEGVDIWFHCEEIINQVEADYGLEAGRLLSLLDEREIEQISPFFELVNYPAKSIVFKEGEPGDFVGFVVSGKLEVKKQTEFKGNQVIIALLSKGALVGELSMFDKEKRSATVEAVEDTAMIIMTNTSLESLIQTYPYTAIKLMGGLIRILSVRLRKATERLTNIF